MFETWHSPYTREHPPLQAIIKGYGQWQCWNKHSIKTIVNKAKILEIASTATIAITVCLTSAKPHDGFTVARIR